MTLYPGDSLTTLLCNTLEFIRGTYQPTMLFRKLVAVNEIKFQICL